MGLIAFKASIDTRVESNAISNNIRAFITKISGNTRITLVSSSPFPKLAVSAEIKVRSDNLIITKEKNIEVIAEIILTLSL